MFGPMPMMDSSAEDAKRALLVMGLDKIEAKEIDQADRAKRLAALFETDVWKLDLAPMMSEMYDLYLEKVKAKEVDPDVLKVLDDLMVRLGGALQLGIGAMRRIAERRLGAAEKMAEQVPRTKRTLPGY